MMVMVMAKAIAIAMLVMASTYLMASVSAIVALLVAEAKALAIAMVASVERHGQLHASAEAVAVRRASIRPRKCWRRNCRDCDGGGNKTGRVHRAAPSYLRDGTPCPPAAAANKMD
jgi:hypothetical protein